MTRPKKSESSDAETEDDKIARRTVYSNRVLDTLLASTAASAKNATYLHTVLRDHYQQHTSLQIIVEEIKAVLLDLCINIQSLQVEDPQVLELQKKVHEIALPKLKTLADAWEYPRDSPRGENK
jgi:hypothetical protein